MGFRSLQRSIGPFAYRSLCLLSVTAAKSISQVKPSNKGGTSQGVPKNRSIVRLGVAAGKAKENGADGEQTHHEWIVEMGDDAHC